MFTPSIRVDLVRSYNTPFKQAEEPTREGDKHWVEHPNTCPDSLSQQAIKILNDARKRPPSIHPSLGWGDTK